MTPYTCSIYLIWVYFRLITQPNLHPKWINVSISINQLEKKQDSHQKVYFPTTKPRSSKECNLSGDRGVGHAVALKGVDTSWHDAGRQPSSIVRGAAIHNGENAIITGTKAPRGSPKPDLLFGSGWVLCRYFISGISKKDAWRWSSDGCRAWRVQTWGINRPSLQLSSWTLIRSVGVLELL